MFDELKDKVIGLAHKTGYQISKHSPQIALVAGIGCGVGALVWMRHAAQQEIVKTPELKQAVKDIREEATGEDGKIHYTEEQSGKLAKAYLDLAVEEVKIYSGPVILGTISFGAFIAGHKILDNRLSDTSAAFAAAVATNQAITERAKATLTPDQYRQVINGDIPEKKTVTKTNEETGEQTEEEVTIYKAPATPGYNVVYFNKDTSTEWNDNGPDYNVTYIRRQMESVERIVNRDGICWYSTILEMLGLPVTKRSRVMCIRKKPNQIYQVSFGQEFDDILEGKNREFYKSFYKFDGTPSIRLEFNVDDGTYWKEMKDNN